MTMQGVHSSRLSAPVLKACRTPSPHPRQEGKGFRASEVARIDLPACKSPPQPLLERFVQDIIDQAFVLDGLEDQEVV